MCQVVHPRLLLQVAATGFAAAGCVIDPLRGAPKLPTASCRAVFVGAATVIVAGRLRFVANDYAGAARSWRTAELSWVRGARRAHTKGDDARARKLAQAVVDRWRLAHHDVLVMAEMKQLLAKLLR